MFIQFSILILNFHTICNQIREKQKISMAFEPSARLVPNNIFGEQNYSHNYQSYQRKKKHNILQDVTNMGGRVTTQKQQKNKHLQPAMNNASNRPQILQLKYIIQNSSEDQSDLHIKNSLKPENSSLSEAQKIVTQRKIKRNILLAAESSSEQGQDQVDNIFSVPKNYQQNSVIYNIKQKAVQGRNGFNEEQDFVATNRAVLSREDQMSVKIDMLKQESRVQDMLKVKQSQQPKIVNKKRFILQFSEGQQSSEDDQQSACVVDQQTGRKAAVKHKQTNENIKISNKKEILLGQFDDSSQSQNQSIDHAQQVKENFQVVKQLNLRAFETANFDYLYIPIPVGSILQCIIRRDKTNKSGKCQYHLYDAALFKHILTIRSASQGGYQFIKKVSPIKEQIFRIATVKSNFLGTQFNCFDQRQSVNKQFKSNLLSVVYQTNILGLKGPRKMQVFIPNQQILCKNSLKQVYDKQQSRVKKYMNKFPKWNKQIGAYVLNFKGRATHSSIKNFIIVREEDQRNLVLFGKVGSQVFNLDIKHPFSIVQAAAMTISSFDKKIACQ